MKFALDTILKKFLFGLIVIALIFLGTSIKVDLPDIVDKILDHFATKIGMLIVLLGIGQKSLPIAIIFAIIYILLSERIVDKEIEKIVGVKEVVAEVVEESKPEEPTA